MKLKHPKSKHTVETDNPEPYLSQGWVEKAEPKSRSAGPPRPKPKGDDD